jgi:PTH1 family peptidyl-tRNA hydrolase
MESLGHKDFQRLRIGVGPDPGGALRAHFVLTKMEGRDLEDINKVADGCVDALELWLSEGIQKAMNQYNGHNFCPEVLLAWPLLMFLANLFGSC